ncbi:MAG: septum formation protein Maf [Rhodobacteraceae bacterium]|nr:septum formation protein Maf [Paracoccaceae bacterium]
MISPKAGSTTVSNKQKRLILASASPRRLELLNRLGFSPHKVLHPDISEVSRKGELPRNYVSRMASEKSLAFSLEENDVLLAADTIVAVGRRIIGKPTSTSHAREILQLLSGRRHRVISGLVVRNYHRNSCKVVETTLRMKNLTAIEIEEYIASGEWQGKAGGYGIQGKAEQFIPWIRGSYSNVVGLPLYETRNMLLSYELKASS